MTHKIPSAERGQHVMGKVRSAGDAIMQADAMARAAIEAIVFTNLYSNRNEPPMYALRKSVSEWLNVTCPDEILQDGRKWEAFIRPHIEKLRD